MDYGILIYNDIYILIFCVVFEMRFCIFENVRCLEMYLFICGVFCIIISYYSAILLLFLYI